MPEFTRDGASEGSEGYSLDENENKSWWIFISMNQLYTQKHRRMFPMIANKEIKNDKI